MAALTYTVNLNYLERSGFLMPIMYATHCVGCVTARLKLAIPAMITTFNVASFVQSV